MDKLLNKLVTLAMISITTLIATIYCFIEYRNNPIVIAIISIVFIGSMFLFLMNCARFYINKQNNLNLYISDQINSSLANITSTNEEMHKLYKASYVQTRKNVELLKEINQALTSSAVTSDIIAAINSNDSTPMINKSVKVLVKYNEANTNKLLSTLQECNIKLLQEFDNIKQASNNSNSIMPITDELSTLRHQLSNKMDEVKDGLNGISKSVSSINLTSIATSHSGNFDPTTDIATSVSRNNIEDDFYDEISLNNDITIDNNIVGNNDISIDVNNSTDNDISIDNDISVDNGTTSDEDITLDTPDSLDTSNLANDFFNDFGNDSTDEAEDFYDEYTDKDDSTEDESYEDESYEDDINLTSNKKHSDSSRDDKVVSFPMDNSNSNATMTPDQIAALFATLEGGNDNSVSNDSTYDDDTSGNLTDDESIPSSTDLDNLQIDEPVTDNIELKEPIAEEAIATEPVAVDPNKPLSPEEIAALFASLS